MKLKCQTCGVGFVQEGNGRRAKYCLKHRRSDHRKRDLATLERQDPDKAAAAREALGLGKDDKPRSKTGQALLLAASLAVEPDLERAAEHAGVATRGDALVELEALARQLHPALVKAEHGAAIEYLTKAINLQVARLVADAIDVPIAVAGNTLKSMQTSKQLLTGGTRPTYSDIELVINVGPDAT